jgi:hypothetical protein
MQEPEGQGPEPSGAPLGPGMRRLLVVATVLVLLAGVQLFVFAERTDEWFAWTIDPPMTAAFLGSAYWASAAVEWTSSRASRWAYARVAVPSVFTFTTLTLVVTVIHLDRFHLDAVGATLAVTWAWIVVYAMVPVLMAILWVRQSRVPGGDPAREHPLTPVLRLVLALTATVPLIAGGWLLVAPAVAGQWWPWELTALTARAIGAWLIGLGVLLAQTVLEADALRARPAAAGAVTLPVLVAVSMARFGSDIDWGSTSAAVLVAFLACWFIMGVALLRAARGGDRR